uniref:Uncharacterized protein n=1 Tax=Pseudomonas sp. (strain WBC-3) TaxID=165468 RepID=A0A0A0RGP7_PSEWB|nr:hypothetical protein WBC3-000042 [Pseudomonas sp. WBC-3]
MHREQRVIAGRAHRHTHHHAKGKVEGCKPKPGAGAGIVIHGIHLMRPRRAQLLKTMLSRSAYGTSRLGA